MTTIFTMVFLVRDLVDLSISQRTSLACHFPIPRRTLMLSTPVSIPSPVAGHASQHTFAMAIYHMIYFLPQAMQDLFSPAESVCCVSGWQVPWKGQVHWQVLWQVHWQVGRVQVLAMPCCRAVCDSADLKRRIIMGSCRVQRLIRALAASLVWYNLRVQGLRFIQ